MASDLSVDLLEEIFLRLDDAADLARALAACASFRRIVSDHRFLRRFRSRHRRRPVLGLLENRGYGEILFHPAQSPRRAALAAAAGFSFSFLPAAGPMSSWRVNDTRDGRVLLSRTTTSRWLYKPAGSYAVEDLVVCDPLHRRHVLIPPIPDDLLLLNAGATTTEDDGRRRQTLDEFEFEPFLAPALAEAENNEDDDRDDGGGDELSFQVMCNVLSRSKVVAFAYSLASRQWRAVASFSNPTIYIWTKLRSLWFRQSVRNCIYWTHYVENFILMLDTHGTMRFSIITVTDVPRTNYYGHFKIAVEAGEGRLGLLLVDDNKLELYSKAWQGNNGGGVLFIPEPSEEWRHDNTIPMPFAGQWILSVAAEGYAVLRGIPMDEVDLSVIDPMMKEPSEAHYFTVDLKTFLIERMGVFKYGSAPNIVYASFPPSFSPPTI